jgi:hypothetical protein
MKRLVKGIRAAKTMSIRQYKIIPFYQGIPSYNTLWIAI